MCMVNYKLNNIFGNSNSLYHMGKKVKIQELPHIMLIVKILAHIFGKSDRPNIVLGPDAPGILYDLSQ